MEGQFYLLWVSILLGIFYLFYRLLFFRTTFFQLNRIYLLSALFLSLTIPILDISTFFELSKVDVWTLTLAPANEGQVTATLHDSMGWLSFIYWIGVVTQAILLVIKFCAISKQLKLPAGDSAFSFWRTMVINPELSNYNVIEAHENVHVRQLHTLDLLIVELIRLFFWFNPLIYCYQRSLKLVHEYLADAYAVKLVGSKKEYAMMLFLRNFHVDPSLVNSLNNPSLLKSRVKMLDRKRSSPYHFIKYGFIFPLIAIMLVLCSSSTSYFNPDEYVQKASFPGGQEAFGRMLMKSLSGVSDKNGQVVLSFTVEADGRITDEKIVKGLDELSNDAVLRAVKRSPKWYPAQQNGRKVISAYQINVNFSVDNQ